MRFRARFLTSLLVVALVALAASPSLAAPVTNVHVSGEVTLVPGFSLQLTANASGTATSLSGRGVDGPFHGLPLHETCEFPLTGSVLGDVVTLTGFVTQSSVKSLIGIPVTIIAHESTGFIVFQFDGVVLTGTGNVDIH